MKSIMLGTVAMATLLTATAGGHTQRLGSDTVDRNGRLDTGGTRLPERSGSDLRHGPAESDAGVTYPTKQSRPRGAQLSALSFHRTRLGIAGP